MRSKLWDSTRHVDPTELPTPGCILAGLSNDDAFRDGGAVYDKEWPTKAANTMW